MPTLRKVSFSFQISSSAMVKSTESSTFSTGIMYSLHVKKQG